MYLYNFILQRATGITHAVHGCFAGTKQQEILLSKGKSLELVRPDPNTGKVHTLLQTEVFGVIRSLMSFRLTGGTKGGLSATLRVKKCGMSCFTRERFQLSGSRVKTHLRCRECLPHERGRFACRFRSVVNRASN